MHPFKLKLLATTVVPLAIAATGVAVGTSWNLAGSKPALAACAPCNPCAARNPGSPCAAANPCNPCAAANPCNPCGAAAPAATTNCVVPRLATAKANPRAATNPCNPCAATEAAANPCNPCAAANPCNPCAAANPCSPCAAANPCSPCAAKNPCNPCAASGEVELTDAEAGRAYDCIMNDLRAAYMKSGNEAAANYAGWRRYSSVAYQSATHGGRYVQNYANPRAKAYGEFEKAGVMPVGSVLAKDSFTVDGNGKVSVGPLFMMEKMAAGFNAGSGNWKYTMIMPTGAVFGVTNGKNSAGMQFCVECHASVAEEQDHMMFMPEEYRIR